MTEDLIFLFYKSIALAKDLAVLSWDNWQCGLNLNQQKEVHSVKNIGQFLINWLLFLLNLFIIIISVKSFLA
ncbi:MAG: hypothetical protein A2145_03165 [candidate division Zixibacteria bacterium RBG_16_40_9]|nr:MAG: hypothetical protein A2145_03165 [candidate division Zixibacteria bacterium RBG_16_40_9]